MNEPHVGDIGTPFILKVIKASDKLAMNLSTATKMQFVFTKPDGSEVVRDAEFFTNGTDGMVQYSTQAGDLDMEGDWKWQGEITLPDDFLHTDIQIFTVLPNLRSP
jgi:hypothetical protein